MNDSDAFKELEEKGETLGDCPLCGHWTQIIDALGHCLECENSGEIPNLSGEGV